jgi:hypothetical protein
MRLKRFMINEEDIIKKGLDTDEPDAKQEYSEEEINHYLAPIISALAALREKGIDSDADEAMFRDLMDKKKQWDQVKPGEQAGKDASPEGEEELPPEGEEELPPEGEEELPPEEEE